MRSNAFFEHPLRHASHAEIGEIDPGPPAVLTDRGRGVTQTHESS
jgi:hypothetical protein